MRVDLTKLVRPLVWVETTSGTSRFPAWRSDAGKIVLNIRDGKYHCRSCVFDTLDDAKAAAQAVYTARILAALDTDAVLFAAAPDLLAALKGAIGALEFSRDYHSDLSNEEQAFAQDMLDAATKAIAKAEGRA